MSYLISNKNPLIQFVTIQGKIPQWVVALLLTFGFIIVGQLLVFLIGMPMDQLTQSNSNPAWKSAVSIFKDLMLGNISVVFLIFLWMYFYEKRPFPHLGFEKMNSLTLYSKDVFIRNSDVWGSCRHLGVASFCKLGKWQYTTTR